MRHRKTITALAAIAALVPARPPRPTSRSNPTEGALRRVRDRSTFQVPHGCDGSGTKRIRVQVPPSVPSATPAVHPGWTTATKDAKKDKVELHGETVTKGVGEIIWTAKEAGPLPDGRLDTFDVSLKLPKGKEGDEIFFPVVQECENGATRWVQIPKAGQTEEDLEEPAPAVVLTAAEGGHGAAAEEKVDAEPVAAVDARR